MGRCSISWCRAGGTKLRPGSSSASSSSAANMFHGSSLQTSSAATVQRSGNVYRASSSAGAATRTTERSIRTSPREDASGRCSGSILVGTPSGSYPSSVTSRRPLPTAASLPGAPGRGIPCRTSSMIPGLERGTGRGSGCARARYTLRAAGRHASNRAACTILPLRLTVHAYGPPPVTPLRRRATVTRTLQDAAIGVYLSPHCLLSIRTIAGSLP